MFKCNRVSYLKFDQSQSINQLSLSIALFNSFEYLEKKFGVTMECMMTLMSIGIECLSRLMLTLYRSFYVSFGGPAGDGARRADAPPAREARAGAEAERGPLQRPHVQGGPVQDPGLEAGAQEGPRPAPRRPDGVGPGSEGQQPLACHYSPTQKPGLSHTIQRL